MENHKILGDGVITGIAKIHGKPVAIFSQDPTCWGGALGLAHAKKIVKIMDFACQNLIPIIGINDSGGARIQEGVESLAGYADIFYKNVLASGLVPQISLIAGPCAGGAVYSPAMTDFVFMVEKTSFMFVTGPDVIKAVTHEEVTKDILGGPKTHHGKSGVAHFSCESENDALERIRELLYYLPSSWNESRVKRPTTDSITRPTSKIKEIIPLNSKKPYDVREVIREITDEAQFLEVQCQFAMNLVVGFAVIGGIKVGIVANQPNHLAGVLDIDSSCKGARFVRFCNAFQIPIITLVDVPGFLPGVAQEHGGIIRHGSKLLFAYCEADVPLITLILRKAYGGAYDVMASKHIGADINLAYPAAELAVMGAEGAVNILYKKELEGLSIDAQTKKRAEYISHYQTEFSNPYKAAELGYIDEVVDPSETRKKIATYLEHLLQKQTHRPKKKSNNIPL
jgi:propionyl-CoA carboxylase beta chain